MSRDPGAPRWFQDIPWRMGTDVDGWAMFFRTGSAQGVSDPLVRLRHERQRRYAVRAAKRRLDE